ncbi:MAG TPA: porin [Nitrospirales bacterium]|nr:porin [Nitrospirales bacterium]
MRLSPISVLVVTAWLLGGAIPAGAADPALNLLLKKGVITQQEYDQALKEAGQAAETPPSKAEPETPAKETPPAKDADGDNTIDLGKGIKFGYDRGLYTQFKDKFQLKIRIRVQTRFTDSRVNSAYGTVGDAKNYPTISGTTVTPRKLQEDVSEFDVRRVRLVFEGFAFNPETTYFVQFRNDTNGTTTQPTTTRSTTQLYDAYITLKQIPWANLRVGQYRTHFGRQEFFSSALLQFVDRGFVAEAFVPNVIDRRDQGVTVFSDQAKYPINYAFGVFNGVGINLTRLGLNTPGNTNELMYVGRVTADLLGKPGYPEGDLEYSLTPQLAVGASYGYNAGLQTNTTGLGSNTQISTAIASLGNGRLLDQGIVDIGTTGVDFVFKYRGFSLQGEGFVRNVDAHDHSKRIGNATGYYVQGGYFIVPKTIEVVGRYGYMDPDTHLSQDILTSAVGGLNWYLNGHEHKLQFDYGVVTTHLSAVDVGGAVTLIENRARLQYTIVF